MGQDRQEFPLWTRELTRYIAATELPKRDIPELPRELISNLSNIGLWKAAEPRMASGQGVKVMFLQNRVPFPMRYLHFDYVHPVLLSSINGLVRYLVEDLHLLIYRLCKWKIIYSAFYYSASKDQFIMSLLTRAPATDSKCI